MSHSIFWKTRFYSSVVLVGAFMFHGANLRTMASEGDENRMIYQTISCRKGRDMNWSVRIVGKVPSLAGCYMIVYNSRGDRVLMKHIPAGEYHREQPLEFSVPKDGTQGDYRIVIVGHEHDTMGIQLPLTDLKKEVYGFSYFAKRTSPSLWFLSDPEVGEYEITAGRNGKFAVLSSGVPVLSPRSDIQKGRERIAARGALAPGPVYELQTTGTFYFQAKPGLYLAFDPSRCFIPDPVLQEVAWWRLTETP